MKILVINGPNLNLLGRRDHFHYGNATLEEINSQLKKIAEKAGYGLLFFQSNHEGDIVDFIQKNSESASGILINPGALTHYGYSLSDALLDAGLKVVEVHLSKIDRREDFRKTDVLDGISDLKISGLKEKSYLIGLEKLIGLLK